MILIINWEGEEGKRMDKRTYPYDELGYTLLKEDDGSERRRVYKVQRKGYVEVGEFTAGDLTLGIYGATTHLHSVHVDERPALQLAEVYFADGDKFLADYMDELDERGIPYGYLNCMSGKYVTFRPMGIHHLT